MIFRVSLLDSGFATFDLTIPLPYYWSTLQPEIMAIAIFSIAISVSGEYYMVIYAYLCTPHLRLYKNAACIWSIGIYIKRLTSFAFLDMGTSKFTIAFSCWHHGKFKSICTWDRRSSAESQINVPSYTPFTGKGKMC